MKENIFYVYEWIRLDTNEPFYIGKGSGNRARSLRKTKKFKDVVDKVGIDNVAYNILHDNLDEETAFGYEIYYINEYKELGFDIANKSGGGEGFAGAKLSAETKARMSESTKRRYQNPEMRKRTSIAVKRAMTPEVRRKIRKANLGRKHSAESRKRMSEGNTRPMLGKVFSESHRRKISEANRGRIVSEETKMKMRLSHLGKVTPEDVKIKISLKVKEAMNQPEFKKNHIELTKKGMEKALADPHKRHQITRFGSRNGMSKKVSVFLNGELIGSFETITEASISLGGRDGNCSTALALKKMLKGWVPSERSKWKNYSVQSS